jgi:hypothetical protein
MVFQPVSFAPVIRTSPGTTIGLVVWLDEDRPRTSPAQLGSAWSIYTWRCKNNFDDYSTMYQGLVDAFNLGRAPDGRALSPASIEYSQICLSNLDGGAASLSLLWRA